jgi:hypothetical protein
MPYRYIIVGNNTFIGFTLGETLTKVGRNVRHLYVPRQSKRCYPEEYFGSDAVPNWTHRYKSLQDLAIAIQHAIKDSDSNLKVLCSGEIESCLLTQLKINHYWVADGADLSKFPFEMTRNGLQIRTNLQSSQYLTGVFSSQRDHKFACRLLGLSNRLTRSFVFPVRPELVDRARQKLSTLEQSLKDPENIKNGKAVIFSAARRVYSGTTTFSKGTEHFVEALERLSDVDADFICTLSGPDAERFRNQVQGLSLKNLTLVSHLPQHELLRILDNPDLIVVDEFGESECCYSGILRESMISAVPIVSDHLFGEVPNLPTPVGLFRAQHGRDIELKIRSILALSAKDRRVLSRAIASQAIEIFENFSWVTKFEAMLQ